MGDSDYTCSLTEESAQRAKEELNEDPDTKLQAVEELREWISKQGQITALTDTSTLLRFLRCAHFDQAKAKKMVEAFAKTCADRPNWLRDVDTAESGIQTFLDTGSMIPLPGRLENGARVLLIKDGAIPPRPDYTYNDEVRGFLSMMEIWAADENDQVGGVVYIHDMAGLTRKHMTRWPMMEGVKWGKFFQYVFPVRARGTHYINASGMSKWGISAGKLFVGKELKDSMYVHNSLESLIQHIPQSMLPDEYKPDDYEGETAGTVEQLRAQCKEKLGEETLRQALLTRTSQESFDFDESKRNQALENPSFFRKMKNLMWRR